MYMAVFSWVYAVLQHRGCWECVCDVGARWYMCVRVNMS